MLSKSYRIPGHLVFQVINKGSCLQTSLFVLKHLDLAKIVLPKDEKLSGKVYFSVLVSKKINKKAVIRNLVKRRMSEAIKKVLDKNKLSGFYVFMVKKDILKAEFSQICDTVAKNIR
jgi:ribonuclease P protein component